ncbi:MAG TPA: FAD:protein FMN transferase, partial [bacterium]|nr:FAD:protein FMN transferase [bacterium]
MHRRQFLKTSGAMLLVCAGAGLGPLFLSKRRVYTMTRPLMGTIGEIHVVSDDARLADRAMAAAFEELQRLENLLTYFSPTSDVGRINSAPTGTEIRIASETADLIERALHWSKVTDGGFEPGLGKVSDVWDVKHRTEPPVQDVWKRYAGLSLHRF